MVKKGFKQLVAEANAEIDTIDVKTAERLHSEKDVVFVDVRDANERVQGFIPGSVHAARGFLEFIVDPESPMHNAALAENKKIVLYCASGGRSALAGKTLRDMGFENVCHIAGGFGEWTKQGGAIGSD